jgi:small subunit ribosomal protein S19
MELTKKQTKFRGKTIEEMKELDVREFAKYIPSRNRRFLLRNFQKIEDFVNRAKKKIEKKKQIKTHHRDLVVVPEMVGMRIHIYHGNGFSQVDVTQDMLGHRFGEFAMTRKKVAHSKAGVGATKGSKSLSKK